MARKRTVIDPWLQPVQPYQFAWALGYRREWPPDEGGHTCLMQGDGLLCRIYANHVNLELYAREENSETTEYGSNVVRFERPAPLQTWFQRLCEVEFTWNDTPHDQAEFLRMYQEAETEIRVEIIKRLFLALREVPEQVSPIQGSLEL